MTVSVVERRRRSGVPAEVVALCARLCAWEKAPAAWCGGRAGWQPLSGADTAAGGVALKLKGLGVAPCDGHASRLPDAEPYDRWPGQDPDPHFGIGSDLEFRLVAGDPAPVGGLTLAGGIREFECAAALSAQGVPAVRPVAVFEYEGRFLHDGSTAHPLGVSVTASPTAGPVRCSVAVPGLDPGPGAVPELRRLAAVLGIGEIDVASVAERLRLLATIYRGFGRTLRAFATAGWYRYSAHPDNVVVDDDGAVVLVDLDSCRPMERGRDDLAALEEVRDGMSALYNLACTFFRPAVMRAVSDEDLLRYEPFGAFLDGWDPDSAGANAAVGSAIARYVVSSRVQLRHFGDFLAVPTPAGEHLYRFVRHDRDLTFSWLYRLAFERRLARPHAHPLPFGLRGLDSRLLRFAGRPRYDRLAALESDKPSGSVAAA